MHYKSYHEIIKKENFPWSAILNKPRPLDKVFHSIIVSLEVLLFREHYLGHPEKPFLHPPSNILLSQTKNSIRTIIENPRIENLLTERSRNLLHQCEVKCMKSIFLLKI